MVFSMASACAERGAKAIRIIIIMLLTNQCLILVSNAFAIRESTVHRCTFHLPPIFCAFLPSDLKIPIIPDQVIILMLNCFFSLSGLVNMKANER